MLGLMSGKKRFECGSRSSRIAAQPAEVVVWNFDGLGIRCQFHGLEWVDHDGYFSRFLFANAALNGTGMWAMRNATRMQGKLSPADVIATHKVTVHVIQYLVRVDVAVVVRGWNGFRMVIIQSG